MQYTRVCTVPFRPVLTDAGGGPTFTMLWTTMRLLATATGTRGRYTVIEQVTPPGWGPPRHIHSREDEIFYILDGSYELHVGDARRTVSSGASAISSSGMRPGIAETPGYFCRYRLTAR